MISKITKLNIGQLKINKSKSKYNNEKITINGHKFDSKAEARRYTYLKLLQRSGKIRFLELQPTFVIQEAFKYNNETIRGIKYISDFKYMIDDETIVEDVKGAITKEYVIKKKLFLKKYGDKITFREIKNKA